MRTSLLCTGLLVGAFFLAPAAQAQIDLDLVWTRVGDAQGAAGEERGTASVESAEFSPDGTLIVAGSKGRATGSGRQGQQVTLWRASDGARLWSRPRADEVEAVAFSPDGALVAAGGEDRIVELLRVRRADGSVLGSPELVATLQHDAAVDGLRFSPDGRLLATGAEDQRVRLWRTSDGVRLDTEVHGGSGTNAVNQMDFTSDGGHLVTAGSNGQVRLWSVSVSEGGGAVQDVSLSPVWSRSHGGSVKSVRFSPDGTLVAAGAGSGAGVRVWSFGGALAEQIGATGWIMEAVAWTPDGRYLFTGGNEGEDDDDNGPFTCSTCGGFGNIRAYDRQNGFALALTQPTFRQEYLDFDADGSRLVSSHEDGTLRLWTVTRGGGTPASGVPVGQTIWLRATVNGRFVAADLTRSGALIADRTEVRSWERFLVTDGADQDPATVALRAEANGKLVAARPGAVVTAADDQAGPASRFAWEAQDDGSVCLRSQNTGAYVVAEDAGVSPLRADRSACRGWERFAWGVAGGASLVAAAPDVLVLEAFPNPSAGRATVAFALPDAAGVELAVYDVLGRRVALLAEGAFEGGHHEAAFDGSALPAGLYVVHLQAGDAVRTQRLTLAH